MLWLSCSEERFWHTHVYIFLAANSNPCEHAGKCVNTEGSFHCECLKGYTGPRCEMDINECHSNPCQNDATCLDKIGGFTCLCMPGEGSFWQRRGFQQRKNSAGRAQGGLPALLRWNTKLQRDEAKWNSKRELAVAAPARRTWHLCVGGRKQLEDWERNRSLHQQRKLAFWAGVYVNVFVTIPGKVHVQKLCESKAGANFKRVCFETCIWWFWIIMLGFFLCLKYPKWCKLPLTWGSNCKDVSWLKSCL